MSRAKCITLGALALAFVAGSAAAQTEQGNQALVIRAFGGGYSHVMNLNDATDPAGMAHFNVGYSLGASVGIAFAKYVRLNGEFAFARTEGKGLASLTGVQFNRYFYGGELEARYPMSNNITPYITAGGGGVTIDDRATSTNFSKPAGTFGAGLAYTLGQANIEVFAQGKGLLYKWDQMGFNKTQLDVVYTAGFGYKLPF